MRIPRLVTIVSLAAVALTGCGGKARPAGTVGNSAGAATGVRAIDWQNRTYDSGDGGPFTVVNGVHEFAFDGDGNPVGPDYEPKDDEYVERGSFEVGQPVYGDLDGDGAEEAVIVTYYNGGGTGRFTGIDVYSIRDGQPVVLGGIPGGDRGDGGIDTVELDGAIVVVGRLMSVEGDGACCPSKLARERWRWSGSAFVEDEAARVVEDFGEATGF